jgi:hypothetical protein
MNRTVPSALISLAFLSGCVLSPVATRKATPDQALESVSSETVPIKASAARPVATGSAEVGAAQSAQTKTPTGRSGGTRAGEQPSSSASPAEDVAGAAASAAASASATAAAKEQPTHLEVLQSPVDYRVFPLDGETGVVGALFQPKDGQPTWKLKAVGSTGPLRVQMVRAEFATDQGDPVLMGVEAKSLDWSNELAAGSERALGFPLKFSGFQAFLADHRGAKQIRLTLSLLGPQDQPLKDEKGETLALTTTLAVQ